MKIEKFINFLFKKPIDYNKFYHYIMKYVIEKSSKSLLKEMFYNIKQIVFKINKFIFEKKTFYSIFKFLKNQIVYKIFWQILKALVLDLYNDVYVQYLEKKIRSFTYYIIFILKHISQEFDFQIKAIYLKKTIKIAKLVYISKQTSDCLIKKRKISFLPKINFKMRQTWRKRFYLDITLLLIINLKMFISKKNNRRIEKTIQRKIKHRYFKNWV